MYYLLNGEGLQEQRPTPEEIFEEIEVGDSIRVVFGIGQKQFFKTAEEANESDAVASQLLIVKEKDEDSETVTGVLDPDVATNKRLAKWVKKDSLITVGMHQVFGVMSNDASFMGVLMKLGLLTNGR